MSKFKRQGQHIFIFSDTHGKASCDARTREAATMGRVFAPRDHPALAGTQGRGHLADGLALTVQRSYLSSRSTLSEVSETDEVTLLINWGTKRSEKPATNDQNNSLARSGPEFG